MSFQDLYVQLIDDIDYEPILAFIESHLSHKQVILDAGCGSGVILIPLAEKGYDVVGVDIDSKMLSYAQQTLASKGLPIQLFEHDLRTPISRPFDVILLFNDVINYFKGIKKVVSVLKNALNPHGFILLDLYKEDYLVEMKDYIESETDPIAYLWKASVKNQVLTHQITDAKGTYKVTQYVYPLAYYVNTFKTAGLKVEILPGPDERKYYLKASL